MINLVALLKGIYKPCRVYTEGLDRTDAQELTTLREHIDLLMNHGRIPDDIYASIMKKIEDAGVGGYYELTYDELGMVLGHKNLYRLLVDLIMV